MAITESWLKANHSKKRNKALVVKTKCTDISRALYLMLRRGLHSTALLGFRGLLPLVAHASLILSLVEPN